VVQAVTLSPSKRVPVTLRQAQGDIPVDRCRRKCGFPDGNQRSHRSQSESRGL